MEIIILEIILLLIYLLLFLQLLITKVYEENLFIFGKTVEGIYFTDRWKDSKRLEANLTHDINTILICPKRWGKTSLVNFYLKVLPLIDSE